MELVDKVLQRIVNNNLKASPLKCDWGVKETDFLGYEMTSTSCKSLKKKIDALLKMSAPSNQKQVRIFLGAINFYKSMWPRDTHVLVPFTRLTGQVPFNWEPVGQKAFDKMKVVLATSCLNMYADIKKTFKIVYDASYYQLGPCILQYGQRRRISL